MWMRIAPPGRGSSSHTGLVKYFGPHHWATCLGSIQALNTRSRGASTMRVMCSSRLSGDMVDERSVPVFPVSEFAAVIVLLLLWKFAEVLLQAVKALVPEPAVLVSPA